MKAFWVLALTATPLLQMGCVDNLRDWIDAWEKEHSETRPELREIEGRFENRPLTRVDPNCTCCPQFSYLWYALTGDRESAQTDAVRLGIASPSELRVILEQEGKPLKECTLTFERTRLPVKLVKQVQVRWGVFPLAWGIIDFAGGLTITPEGHLHSFVDSGYLFFIGPLPLLGGPTDEEATYRRVGR